MILVTGGAGFIGANFVLDWLAQGDDPQEGVVTLDKLTYAGNLENLSTVKNNANHVFVQGDIGDTALVANLLEQHKPRAVINFAAESHVDRSILGPGEFIQTNIVGTFNFLEAVRNYWGELPAAYKSNFRFLHVSTDEVYGSLDKDEAAFDEKHRYEPNSPYSASKAASDHLVRAYHHTYGLPVTTSNCSNNYGPYQHSEKLIPTIIRHCIHGSPIPVYGDGSNIRDWLYVEDHCSGIDTVIRRGTPGETYNIGGINEWANIDIVKCICSLMDELHPSPLTSHKVNVKDREGALGYSSLITFVTDRPGHDWRYAIDASRMGQALNWQPAETFETGIRKTVAWYLEHRM